MTLYIIREEEEDESSEEEEDSEEEEEDEESSSEEEAAATTSVTTTAQQPALDRKEIRNQKKKDKQKKTGENGEDEDPDLINPNHVQQKMNISDLNTPRQLTRRERYAMDHIHIHLDFQTETFSYLFFSREQKEKQDAKDRYWKVSFLPADFQSWLFLFNHLFLFFSYMFKERRTRPKQISADLLRFVLSVKLRRPRGKLKLKVSIIRSSLLLLLSLPDLTRFY